MKARPKHAEPAYPGLPPWRSLARSNADIEVAVEGACTPRKLPCLRLAAGRVRQAQRRQESSRRKRSIALVAQRAWITGRSGGRERVASVALAARKLQRRELRRVELMHSTDRAPQRAAAGR
jgi:hypothetical protein